VLAIIVNDEYDADGKVDTRPRMGASLLCTFIEDSIC
jgi:hypothetical protein